MKRRTKPDQLVNDQNEKPGFVVQIPEGLDAHCHKSIHFHPLIVPKSQFFKASDNHGPCVFEQE
jgi:hypothetical protein